MSHVMISGGTRGIGAAITKKFLFNGYDVTCLYSSNKADSDNLASELSDYSSHLNMVCCNVSDPVAVSSTVIDSVSKFGTVDVLVSNAGISKVGLADTFSFEDYHKIMDINFGGFFNLTHDIVPSMISKKGGSIIAISSMWGQTGASCEALYSATKGAIDSYVKALAKELGPSGIRVNAVSPGVVQTNMLNCFSEDDLNSLAEETPLGRIGNPEDIANMVYFLTTDEGSFVTGQIIGVNGGFLI